MDIAYIATLISPVNHRLYDVIVYGGETEIVNPLPYSVYVSVSKDAVLFENRLAVGYYDEDDEVELEEGTFYRSHTPRGASEKGIGLGLLLYSGLALSAKWDGGNAGIYSSMDQRSSDATKWWKNQVRRDYAEESSSTKSACTEVDVDFSDAAEEEGKSGLAYELGVDEDTVHVEDVEPSSAYVQVCGYGELEIQYLTADRVAERGLIVAYNDEDADLSDIEQSLTVVPPAVLLGVKLDNVRDPNVINEIVRGLHDQGVPQSEIAKFLETVPAEMFPQIRGDVLPILGQETFDFLEYEGPPRRRMQKNPTHSAAWQSFFGNLTESE
jgi:hypothetical protein